MDTKRKYSENSLVDFYKLYMCEKFFLICPVMQKEWPPSLVAPTAVNNFSPRWTICRSQLTDEHLTSQLKVSTTSVKTDIDKLYKDSKFQVSH